jgi:ABC-type Mn2+/Zn2+ transport system permease subunit
VLGTVISNKMSKTVFFGIVQGTMWNLTGTTLGYKIGNWQWWLILVIGSLICALIYSKCKDK